MTLSSITGTAASGLLAAQLGLNVISDNVANLNTPGYVEKVIQPNSQVVGGVGDGVSGSGVTLAANQFLQNASLAATASAAQASAVSTCSARPRAPSAIRARRPAILTC